MRKMLLLSLTLVGISLLTGCAGKAGETDAAIIPVLDMEKQYPKEEVPLQGIGKVRYIRLETSADALLDEGMRLSPSGKGLFFFDSTVGGVIGFDNNGNRISNFNHKGQGVNEYNSINKIAYDGENQQIHILSYSQMMNLLTFDLSGNCLRAVTLPDTLTAFDMVLLDPASLLVWDTKNFKVIKEGKISKIADTNPEPDPNPFVLLNSEDGTLSSRLPISCPGHIRPLVFTMVDNRPFVQMASLRPIVPSSNGILLNDCVADTVFWVSTKKEIKPILTRIPSIHANVQKGKICEVLAMSSRYLLLNVIWLNPEEGSSVTGLKNALHLWDADKQGFIECTFRNSEFKGEGGLSVPFAISGDKLYFRYFPYQLLEALGNNHLSGDLEQLARSLEEDDNLVLMEVSL